MRSLIRLFTLLSFLLLIKAGNLHAQSGMRVASFNVQGFSANEDSARRENIRLVLEELDANIIAVQGMGSLEAMLDFAKLGLGVTPQLSTTGNFSSVQDRYNVMLFDVTKFEIVGQMRIDTPIRDAIAISILNIETGDTITVVTVESVEGSTNDAINFRAIETKILDSLLRDKGFAGTNLIIAGAVNAPSSSDSSIEILRDGPLTMLDPSGAFGTWNRNSANAEIHTSSSRFDDVQNPGLVDRADMILISQSLEANLVAGSYTVFGNDGEHFGRAVNDGVNSAVSDGTANALHSASSHLPVYIDLRFGTSSVLGSGRSNNLTKMDIQ